MFEYSYSFNNIAYVLIIILQISLSSTPAENDCGIYGGSLRINEKISVVNQY